ncbi:hypothetical protein R8Z50_21370 [Longispora sp. K20-0274]|uniref:hypothetical protein n=1 Tax=Longispora sp. K20-0274 TaxID=3088255 RepID=UPI00399A8BF3
MRRSAVGFVGTGALTAAIVAGLSEGVAEPPTILLSPRGRATGLDLAARYPNARVCASNQDVVSDAGFSRGCAARSDFADGSGCLPVHLAVIRSRRNRAVSAMTSSKCVLLPG